MSESDTYDTDSDVDVTGETFTNMNAILQDILKEQTETNRVSWANNY